MKDLQFWRLRAVQRFYDATLGRLIDAHIRNHLLFKKVIFGDPARVSVAPTAAVNNALFNVQSGRITVLDHAFFGQNVCLLTGTHEIGAPLEQRVTAIPHEGRDIVVGRGAWLASNTTVLGPCVIGEMAVVAAGAVVTRDVEPYTIVGGVPARVIGHVPRTATSPAAAGVQSE